jgi:hypothetical protein
MNRRQFLIASGSAPLLAQTAAPAPELEWVDAKKLTVEGLGFRDVKSPYDRLPGRAERVVPAPVWNLSHDSAGALVHFTDATTEIHARWTVTGKSLAGANITAIASSGLDLYARTDAGKWRWLGIGQPTFPETTATLVAGIPATEREFMVYLPLRNGVTSLDFGVPKGSIIKPGPARAPGSKPIVFYGTSITHGIGASRAGMTHVAMLGRTFNREVINLGFSGNGRMEPEVVRFVAELDPAVFVLDCLPNMNPQQITERIVPGVKMLREAHPGTPILHSPYLLQQLPECLQESTQSLLLRRHAQPSRRPASSQRPPLTRCDSPSAHYRSNSASLPYPRPCAPAALPGRSLTDGSRCCAFPRESLPSDCRDRPAARPRRRSYPY